MAFVSGPDAGERYERFMGRWTRVAARRFVPWVGARRDAAWLDVGTGTGIVAQTILDMAWPGSVTGIDISPDFVEHARVSVPGARFEVADAEALPFPAASFDAVVCAFALGFVARPDRAVAEMARVARPGSTVAACIWERDAGIDLLDEFWEAAVAADPAAAGHRPPARVEIAGLLAAFRQAELGSVDETRAVGTLGFDSFEDLWQPFTLGVGPQGRYLATLDGAGRAAVRAQLEQRFPPGRRGAIEVQAVAVAVRAALSSTAAAAFNAALEPFWHPVARSADVGHEAPLGVELLGRPLCLVRMAGRLVALDDVCRHLGASLSLGEPVEVEGAAALRCRYHGWAYGADGRVVDIPARRDLPIPREARVGAHRVEERYGLAWVCLDPHSRRPLPEFAEFSEPGFRVTPIRAYEPWRASAPRVVMAALDDTHFPWVHPGLLGDRDRPQPPDHRVATTADAVTCEYTTMQPANDSIGGAGMEEVAYRNTATPTTIHLLKSGPSGRYAIFDAVCPESSDRARVFLQVARDFDVDPARDESYLEFEDRVQAQDRPVVESQRPWLLPPLTARMSLYVRPADLPLVAFQRWLEELGVPQV